MNTKLIHRSFVFTLALLTSSMLCQQAWAQVAKASPLRSITVSTQPETTVWIDGVRYGKTNKSGTLKITSVAVGTHTLRLRADGFKERSQPITAIQKGEIRVTLVKTTDEAELAYQEAERLASTDRDKSAEAYKKAVKLRPGYPEALIGLARVLNEAGDLDDAESDSQPPESSGTVTPRRPQFRAASTKTTATSQRPSRLSNVPSPRAKAFSLRPTRALVCSIRKRQRALAAPAILRKRPPATPIPPSTSN